MVRILTTLLLFLSFVQAIKAQTIVIDSAFEMVLLPQEEIKKNKIERIDIAQSFITKNGNTNRASITNSFNRKGRLECSKFRQGGFEKDSCIEKMGQYQWKSDVVFKTDKKKTFSRTHDIYETDYGYKVRIYEILLIDSSLDCGLKENVYYIIDEKNRVTLRQDTVNFPDCMYTYTARNTYTEDNTIPTEVIVNDNQYYTIEQLSDSALVVHRYNKLSDFAAKQHTEGVTPLPDYKEIKTIYIDIKRSNGLPAEIEVRHETIQRDYQQKPPLMHQEQWKYTYR